MAQSSAAKTVEPIDEERDFPELAQFLRVKGLTEDDVAMAVLMAATASYSW